MSEAQISVADLELVGGRLCLDFTNTVGYRGDVIERDRLRGYEELLLWGEKAGVLTTGEREELLRVAARTGEAEAVFRRAIDLREALYRVFLAAAEEEEAGPADLEILNRELSRALARARVVATPEGFDWGWDDAPEPDRVLWPVARSAAELLVSPELPRVGKCAGERCAWLFLDTSKNRSRRWCDMRDCGNRAKVRRHYRRRGMKNVE